MADVYIPGFLLICVITYAIVFGYIFGLFIGYAVQRQRDIEKVERGESLHYRQFKGEENE